MNAYLRFKSSLHYISAHWDNSEPMALKMIVSSEKQKLSFLLSAKDIVEITGEFVLRDRLQETQIVAIALHCLESQSILNEKTRLRVEDNIRLLGLLKEIEALTYSDDVDRIIELSKQCISRGRQLQATSQQMETSYTVFANVVSASYFFLGQAFESKARSAKYVTAFTCLRCSFDFSSYRPK